jgi:hypothetical protein
MSRGITNQNASRLGTSQNFAPAGSSVQSTAFSSQCVCIRVCSTAAVNYRIDSAPTAVATDALLPANVVEYLVVSPGQKIAAIGTATVNVTEVVG